MSNISNEHLADEDAWFEPIDQLKLGDDVEGDPTPEHEDENEVTDDE